MGPGRRRAGCSFSCRSRPPPVSCWSSRSSPPPTIPPRGLGAKDALGVLVFLGALAGAALSDEQLRRFKADPANRGKVCDVGLWGYSRHPNYFFEWLGWVAFPIIAISGAHLWGLAAFAAPALMYLLLVHVSGIPPLEAHMQRSRGAAFDLYRARVNAFFPGPQRNPRRSPSTP